MWETGLPRPLYSHSIQTCESYLLGHSNHLFGVVLFSDLWPPPVPCYSRWAWAPLSQHRPQSGSTPQPLTTYVCCCVWETHVAGPDLPANFVCFSLACDIGNILLFVVIFLASRTKTELSGQTFCKGLNQTGLVKKLGENCVNL